MPRPGRKSQILEAAVSLFSAKGYHGTTVRDIAEESGMLSGSLYAHINSKEDLLFEIVEQAAGQFLAAVGPIAAGPGPAAARLEAAMAAHSRIVAGSLPAATIFLHDWRSLEPERRGAIMAKRQEYEALFGRIICDGVERGEFRPVDDRFARLLVLSAVNWLYQWYSPEGPLGPDEIASRFAALILGGLQAERGTAEREGA
jgi:TetR/AcrR family transcriptional regulator, cholesterol catabolism regulator